MSNLIKRILTGIIGVPVLLLIFYMEGIYFFIFSLFVTCGALWEFFRMSEKKNFHPLKIPGMVLSSMLLMYSYISENDPLIFLPVVFILLAAAEVIRSEDKNPLNPVIAVSGILYITVPFVLLGKINGYSGLNLLVYIFVMIWICDTAAYFGGKFFGRHKLSSISPNKTLEGSAAGFLFTLLSSAAVHYIYPDKLSLTDALSAGIITGVLSQTGDLFESLLKRYAGVKDSSEIIPGHGGILDRFDSVIFVAPVLYIYFKYIG